jgi:hypothetical protein
MAVKDGLPGANIQWLVGTSIEIISSVRASVIPSRVVRAAARPSRRTTYDGARPDAIHAEQSVGVVHPTMHFRETRSIASVTLARMTVGHDCERKRRRRKASCSVAASDDSFRLTVGVAR